MNKIDRLFQGAIFLDVGCHTGQTLDAVTKYKYDFRTIYGFEPMPRQCAHLLRAYRTFPNVQVFDYGLGDHTGITTLYGSNERFESSIYAEKSDVATIDQTACTIVEASNWFQRNLTEDDVVIMKINAEGSEIPIMNNLIDSGQVWKIYNVMLDFDIRRVVGMEHTEQELLQRLSDIGFTRFSLCDHVMKGFTHQDRIENWLSTIE